MIKAYAKSDVGKQREVNEDSFYITQDPLNKIQLFILADGMGGCNAGEIASSQAILCTKNYIENNFDETPKDRESLIQLVASSMEYANMIVYEKSVKEKKYEGMGTTLEVCLIYNNRAYIGHIGDSRIYRIRKEFIRRITTDHSYVEQLIKEGTITRIEAKNHPKKNVLTKALGCSPYVEPDIMVKNFLENDILVMTSDGLTNMVENIEIYNTIKKDINSAALTLIKKANEQGGVDNITVIIIEN